MYCSNHAQKWQNESCQPHISKIAYHWKLSGGNLCLSQLTKPVTSLAACCQCDYCPLLCHLAMSVYVAKYNECAVTLVGVQYSKAFHSCIILYQVPMHGLGTLQYS